MKNARKLLAMVLAVLMVTSLATTAFAEDGYTITVNGKADHTYEVYQIFTGDLYEGVLSNIVWGNGVTEVGRTAIGDAAVQAETLTASTIKAFAAEVNPYLTNAATMTAGEADAAGNIAYTISGLAAGYYLIKDQDGSQDGENGTYTAYILKVVEDVEATPKDSVPSVDKEIVGAGEATDANIGDTVTMTLTATLGNNLDEYKTYKVVFHDTMSDGLTFVEYVSATVDGTDATAKFEMTQAGRELTFICKDVIALGAEDGSEIVITYTAKLNEAAVIGQPGNPNTVYLEYSNNPNWDIDGDGQPDNPNEPDEPTSETPEDVVIIFTYELDVTKVNGEDQSVLKDAEFVLYRQTEEGTAEYVQVDEAGIITGWTADKDAASVLKSDEEGLFKVIGLDAGTYYLEETRAPAGYNLLVAPIEFVIEATVNNGEDTPALEALSISVGEETEAGDVKTGVVGTTVVNQSGVTLPSTGGIGTTLFYILGGILVLAAVVLLVTKRRMNYDE